MLRATVLLLAILLSPSFANGQTVLSLEDIPVNSREALLVDLSDDNRLTGHLLVRPRVMTGVDFILVPLAVDWVKSAGDALALHQSGDGILLMGYAVTPQLTSSKLFELGIVPNRESVADDTAFKGSTTIVEGLTVRSTGVRRHIVWNLKSTATSRRGPAAGARLPDIIAFGLPENFEGRTLSGSSSMTFPTSLSGPNPIIIAQSELSEGRIEIAYDLPEPEAYVYFTKFAARSLGVLLAVLLLGVTQTDKLDKARYRPVFWITLALIVAIYGALIGWGFYVGANLTEIVTELLFAFLTIAAALITNYVQTRNRPTETRSPAL